MKWALSFCLGCVLAQIMKDRQRAADCNKRCIVLASAIYPIPYGADWYRVRACHSRVMELCTQLTI